MTYPDADIVFVGKVPYHGADTLLICLLDMCHHLNNIEVVKCRTLVYHDEDVFKKVFVG